MTMTPGGPGSAGQEDEKLSAQERQRRRRLRFPGLIASFAKSNRTAGRSSLESFEQHKRL